MEKLAKRVLSHTTIGKVLKCTTVPLWDQLTVIVDVLGGDQAKFKTLWVAARDAADSEPTPVELAIDLLKRENQELRQEREALAAMLSMPGPADPPEADRDATGAHRHTLRQLTGHARLILVQDKIEVARVLMEHALNGYRRMPGATPEELHQAMVDLAEVMLRDHKPAAAVALSRQVYAYFRRTDGRTAHSTLTAGYVLVRALHDAGSHHEADHLRDELKGQPSVSRFNDPQPF